MADLKTTQEERAEWRAILDAESADMGAAEVVTSLLVLSDLDTLLAENARLRAAEAENAKLRSHYDAAAPEHNLLALLDLYEGRRLEAEAEVERLRGLVRWFLDGDDHTHEDDCGARGSHDLDVCRNTRPCADETCEGPHCACGATEMRARALAALEAP